MILGYILIGFSLIGMIVSISYLFNWDLFKNDYYTFGRGDGGGASNTPVFYGLMAIAGSILLVSVKKEKKLETKGIAK